MNLRFLALLCMVSVASAQTSPPYPSTYKYYDKSTSPPGGYVLNVKDFGAKFDAVAATGCTITSGTKALTCIGSTFTAADVGKAIAITGAGSSASTTLTTTIASYTSATQVGLTANAGTTIGADNLYVSLVPGQATFGSGYVAGDTVTLSGGTFTTAGVLNVRSTNVSSIAVNAAGSGGTNGACTITGTTGTGSKFIAAATVSGGVLSAVGALTVNGYYTVNPTSLSSEPVTSNCGLTGATVTITMGIEVSGITTAGSYSVKPTNPVAQASTSGVGTGATFNISFNTRGIATYGTDDTAAWNAAIAKANAIYAAGSTRTCIYMPPGSSVITASLTEFAGPGCVYGAPGVFHSTIYAMPSLSGDIFSWSDAWASSSSDRYGLNISTNKIGPAVQNLTIVGDRSAAADATAFHFYDRNDYIFMDTVTVFYLKGQAIKTGEAQNTAVAFIRESTFRNIRAFNCGDTGKAAIEFSAAGVGTGGTPVDLQDINIYAPYGDGLYIHNEATGSLREYAISRLRVEGIEDDTPGVAGDLLHIGSSTTPGQLFGIHVNDAQLIGPYYGYSALHVEGATGHVPYDIQFRGVILGGTQEGGGIYLQANRLSYYKIPYLNTTQTAVTVGPSPPVAAGIVIDGGGSESTWTYNVDASAAGFISNVRNGPFSSGNFATGLTSVATGKTFTASNTLTLTATDGSTLAVGAGGTLGTAAYQATGTSGANVPLLNGANTWSGAQTFSALVTPSTTIGVKGTAAADSVQAGSVGEVLAVNCPSTAAGGTVTFTSASPTVATWSSHTFTTTGSPANYTCSINFSNSGGALPTGISAATNYFIVGSTVSGDTFQLADTPGHALAATNKINTSDAGTGTQTGFLGTWQTTGTLIAGEAISLTAGDWDCVDNTLYFPVTNLTTTGAGTGLFVGGTTNTFTAGQYSRGFWGSFAQTSNPTSINTPTVQVNVSATTTVSAIHSITFSAGTVNGGGFLRCRRMR